MPRCGKSPPPRRRSATVGRFGGAVPPLAWHPPGSRVVVARRGGGMGWLVRCLAAAWCLRCRDAASLSRRDGDRPPPAVSAVPCSRWPGTRRTRAWWLLAAAAGVDGRCGALAAACRFRCRGAASLLRRDGDRPPSAVSAVPCCRRCGTAGLVCGGCSPWRRDGVAGASRSAVVGRFRCRARHRCAVPWRLRGVAAGWGGRCGAWRCSLVFGVPRCGKSFPPRRRSATGGRFGGAVLQQPVVGSPSVQVPARSAPAAVALSHRQPGRPSRTAPHRRPPGTRIKRARHSLRRGPSTAPPRPPSGGGRCAPSPRP